MVVGCSILSLALFLPRRSLVMLRFSKISFAIAFLACHSLAFSQTQPPPNSLDPVRAALRARDFDKAIELTKSALKQSPNNDQLWTLQGIAYVSKGDSKDALVSFQQALKIAPNNVPALEGAGQIQYQ